MTHYLDTWRSSWSWTAVCASSQKVRDLERSRAVKHEHPHLTFPQHLYDGPSMSAKTHTTTVAKKKDSSQERDLYTHVCPSSDEFSYLHFVNGFVFSSLCNLNTDISIKRMNVNIKNWIMYDMLMLNAKTFIQRFMLYLEKIVHIIGT